MEVSQLEKERILCVRKEEGVVGEQSLGNYRNFSPLGDNNY